MILTRLQRVWLVTSLLGAVVQLVTGVQRMRNPDPDRLRLLATMHAELCVSRPLNHIVVVRSVAYAIVSILTASR
jgi:hypothetical protein